MRINKSYILPVIGLLTATGLLLYGPIAQEPSYHSFADTRTMLGIPSCLNVITNLPFAVVAFLGLSTTSNIIEKRLKLICTTIFIAFLLLAVGSGYYHLHPNNNALVYDRIPISIITMSLFSFIIYDRVHHRKGYFAFIILNMVGVLSVIYWILTEHAGKGDLRWYGMVQFFPLIAIPLTLWMYKSSNHYTREIVWMFLFFALTKLAETYDKAIYPLLSNTVSGHSLKHLSMAAAGYEIALLFRRIKKGNLPFISCLS